jgi:hypothetical protein
VSESWQYQIRITLADAFAAAARRDAADPALKPLADILRAHDAEAKCQHDQFAAYVAEAEANGPENYPLYAWTRATVENPEKRARFEKSFTLYVGGAEVYAKAKADALEADLAPLVGGMVTKLAKYDTNPANNPQPPGAKR